MKYLSTVTDVEVFLAGKRINAYVLSEVGGVSVYLRSPFARAGRVKAEIEKRLVLGLSVYVEKATLRQWLAQLGRFSLRVL